MVRRLLIALVFPLTIQGQVSEDFSAGNIKNSSIWKGDQHAYRINQDQQLQLNDTEAGASYLSTYSSVSTKASWKFDVRLTFNPSSQNYVRIYLMSDVDDLSAELNGYYISIGGPDDEINLFRQDRSEHIKIIDSRDHITDLPELNMEIEVTRSDEGQWQLTVRSINDSEPQIIGQVVDTVHTRSAFFGFYCTYTKTRSDGFYFDNVNVNGQQFIDIEPPFIESIEAEDMNVKIKFSEPIVMPSLNQFQIDELGSPTSVVQSVYATLELSFAQPLLNATTYTLEAINISDFFENTASLSIQFQFWDSGLVDEYGILITEVMADPSPPLQLAEVEYVELFNPSGQAVNLKNWSLSDESRSVQLPQYLLVPGQYLLIHPLGTMKCPDEVECLELSAWPTLNNSGDVITLTNDSGVLIHSLSYDYSWYRSEIKRQGGWSLEMIDTRYPCSGRENWTASVAPSGGTPGSENSVATDNPDLTPPRIVSTFADSPNLISLTFDQPLSANTLNPEATLDPIIDVDTTYFELTSRSNLVLVLAEGLEENLIYELNLKNIADCNGNITGPLGTSSKVALPQSADSGDLIINEVLFNPKPLGSRFVELYNRSTKALNLKNWKFGRKASDLLVDMVQIFEDNRMIYPGEYIAFSDDPEKIRMHYPLSYMAPIIEVDDLPKLGDNQGSILLLSSFNNIIDRMSYDSDMHHVLLKDQNGVSLERGDPNQSAANFENWYSGAELSGYATPGLPNSQQHLVQSGSMLAVDPDIISPASLQLPNYALISFNLHQPGASGSIDIFNSQGFLTKSLVSNALLPTNGSYQWDGTDNNDRPVTMGYYIVVLQLTNQSGRSQHVSQTLVVAP